MMRSSKIISILILGFFRISKASFADSAQCVLCIDFEMILSNNSRLLLSSSIIRISPVSIGAAIPSIFLYNFKDESFKYKSDL